MICLSQKRGTANLLSVFVTKCVELVRIAKRKNFAWAVVRSCRKSYFVIAKKEKDHSWSGPWDDRRFEDDEEEIDEDFQIGEHGIRQRTKTKASWKGAHYI